MASYSGRFGGRRVRARRKATTSACTDGGFVIEASLAPMGLHSVRARIRSVRGEKHAWFPMPDRIRQQQPDVTGVPDLPDVLGGGEASGRVARRTREDAASAAHRVVEALGGADAPSPAVSAHRAFTSEKVMKLTGLSARQLQYWDEQRFLSPSLRGGKGKGRRRLYDFRDLVSLRVAADLRRQGISLQLIRKAVAHLRELDYEEPLSQIRFWSPDGKQLLFSEADTIREARRPAQTIAWWAVPVAAIVDELERGIVRLDRRQHGRVERRRGALGSKLLIAGTRIPVESVQRLHTDGADEGEILRLYPDLNAADVRAALAEELPPRRIKRAI